MKIRTIICPMNDQAHANIFDSAVNESLAEGWVLTKREVLPGGPLNDNAYLKRMLYVELVLPDPPVEPQEVDLFDCAEAIRKQCESVESCTECPLEDVCACYAPNKWKPAGAP